MSNSWDKVRSFLEMMDIQNLHSPHPSSFTSSSSSNCNVNPLQIDVRRWEVGDRTAQQILSVIQPNAESENRRKEIIEYLQKLIEDVFEIKVFPFGSVPLKTYLPHGDIDLTAVSYSNTGQDLAAEICHLLENEEKRSTRIQVEDVLCVPAQVKIVKCTVGGICVDISFNQTTGLCSLYFLEQVDRFIGKDHFFKRSVILIKAWCYYESRILGGFHGLISTYALETMVLHVINLFHSSLTCPLAVLYKFLEYYSTFDWTRYCVDINGLVLISSLPDIVVQAPHDCDDLLLTDNFLRSSREAILSSMGIVGTKNSVFPVKFLNILDPLRDENNLGRSVNKGNFHRIKAALSYGTKKLGDILMLPSQNIECGLEKFFKDTLERNGNGRRADVTVPVDKYGSNVFTGDSDHDHLLSGIHYVLWFLDYGVMYPVLPEASAHCTVWNNQCMEMGHTVQFDQSLYSNINISPPSVNLLTSFTQTNAAYVTEERNLISYPQTNATYVTEERKSRGTGTYIPNLEHLMRRHFNVEARNEEQEKGKEVESVDSPSCTSTKANLSSGVEVNTNAFNFSIEDFPILPGSKPIPIKVNQSNPPETKQVKETSVSLDSIEFDSFKHSSPRSLSLSEAGKLSDSDVSAILDLVSDPTTVTVLEDQDLSKSEEKMVVPVQPLQLADDSEFPPLSRPPEPVITLNKKEFPPLRACLKSQKKGKWKSVFK
ncbi:uncharacterized protein LOC110723179 [Chenopodium quinoa]|uniref:uncharacterized protein LOC110723179 n=1 Tax=Chenopodium quinoa TaxID=63459 RepID=UPI000B7705BD|nr:uncharacterized protein LOC110723179 [Chenopodium quinoa]XP_021758200.1 uncharacterized protein LOC110723179 [Chenopodium quinoa]XP_021758201.1 uncharacterized protein LOC110723179 [Chenopodium quinoa]XP_021758202.1 uncharacterized protein LOC110723179 [Chenopodium quinoa]